jgi:hypothetical protein
MIALVGRVHRCVPVEPKPVKAKSEGKFDRVAYQRDYMRRKRAKDK